MRGRTDLECDQRTDSARTSFASRSGNRNQSQVVSGQHAGNAVVRSLPVYLVSLGNSFLPVSDPPSLAPQSAAGT